MSIYIKGISMPKEGEFVPLRIYDNGEVTIEVDGEEVKFGTAMNVPPHGKLIDVDASYNVVEKIECGKVARSVFANAVIPVDPDGES